MCTAVFDTELTQRAADLYPYLLVNIGSGVSMVKVDGEGKYTRVSGEHRRSRCC